MDLVFAEGKFVCVGGGGGGENGGGHILVSENGHDWRHVMEAKGRANPIVYGAGRFVVGGAGRHQGLVWSEDAETWEEGAVIDGYKGTHWLHGAYGNNRFVLTGNNGGETPAWVVTSKDGTTIDSYADGIPSVRDIAYGNGRFVLVGAGGVRRSSTDGTTWDSHDAGAADITWVAFTGERFLCGTDPVSSSEDGTTWEDKPELKVRGVKWTDGQRFICTAWPGKMSYSHDGGKTLHPANELTPNGINAVVVGTPEP